MTNEDCLITSTLIWSWMGDYQWTKGVETHSFEFLRENTWREREWCGIFKACAQTWGDWLVIFSTIIFGEVTGYYLCAFGLCHEAKSSSVVKEVRWIVSSISEQILDAFRQNLMVKDIWINLEYEDMLIYCYVHVII